MRRVNPLHFVHTDKLSPFLRLRAARRWIVGCLMVALPIYGWSAAVVVLLGTSHVHVHPVEPSGQALKLIDFRRVGHVAEAAPEVHSHPLFQRHHHAFADHSVRSLGDAGHQGAVDDGSAAGSSAALVMGLAGTIRVAAAGVTAHGCWPGVSMLPIDHAGGERLERPPRVV